MRILGIVVLGAALVPVGALGQINDDVAAVAGPWHHVPNAMSAQQFNRDAAKCRVIAAHADNQYDTRSCPARDIQRNRELSEGERL
jgi:hypothetical protein